MKDTKRKIEFWLHKDQKDRLKKLADSKGYSISEILRRAIELIEKELLK